MTTMTQNSSLRPWLIAIGACLAFGVASAILMAAWIETAWRSIGAAALILGFVAPVLLTIGMAALAWVQFCEGEPIFGITPRGLITMIICAGIAITVHESASALYYGGSDPFFALDPEGDACFTVTQCILLAE